CSGTPATSRLVRSGRTSISLRSMPANGPGSGFKGAASWPTSSASCAPMAVSSAPRTSLCRAYTLRGEGVMRKRGYLDLTPTELLARRYVVWGVGLFAVPSLLTSCHTLNYLCQARWDGGALSLVTLWAPFPWMLPIALVMFGGLGMCMLGAVLFLS